VAPRPAPAAKAMPMVLATPATPAADREVAAYRALSPPPYPKGRKVEGRVLLDILVGSDGRAEDVKLARSSGDAELDASTVEAARQWRFEPAVRGGKAVASRVQVPVEFAHDAGAVADDAVELRLTPAGTGGAATLDAIRVGQ
ncbi:MAG: energy transducer TonB, partial [Lysobacter sp.]|nr:energy transducer TonB [Lysobacter sp.]